jgi:hypothetical protein
MSEWQTQCPHCSQIFDAKKAIWCKCSYQYPTKICPYCLKCACEFKEAFIAFWQKVPHSEKVGLHFILRKKQFPEWLESSGIIKSGDIKDIVNESKISNISILKAAYKLGYFDKNEILQLKKIINLTPADLLQGACQHKQNSNIWNAYSGIIIDRMEFNRQSYTIVAFPFGANTSGIFKIQEILKTLIIPIFIELRIWKMIAEEVCTEKERDINNLPSYSIREWFEKLINEAITTGQEHILIEAEPSFHKKSNIFMLKNSSWVLHSIAPIEFNALEWTLQNMISPSGKSYKNNFYLKYTSFNNKILINIQPNNWHTIYPDNDDFKRIVSMLNCKSGLLIIRTYGNADLLGRMLVKFAEKQKYPIVVNNASITGDNTTLIDKLPNDVCHTFMKNILLIKDINEFSAAKSLSRLNFVVAIVDISSNIKEEEIEDAMILDFIHFLRLKQLCKACKLKANYNIKNSHLTFWEHNSEGCATCQYTGYHTEKLIFIRNDIAMEEILSQLIKSGEYDWRDLSIFQPKLIFNMIF